MQVHSLLLADSVQAVEGKLYMLGGAWNMLNVTEFPTTHLVGIGFAIDVGWNETNQRHHAVIFVEDADGNRLPEPRIEVEFEAGRPAGHPAGADLRLVFAVNGPIAIAAPGSYSVVIQVGDGELGRTRFHAVPTQKK